jgi:hypothetical protein
MLTTNPPSAIRPRQSRGPKKTLFTIHKQDNTIYASKPTNDLVLISVVSFSKRDNALLIASMLEEYKRRTNEWPLLTPDDDVFLPSSEISTELQELEIIGWTQDALNEYCAEHILDLITIQNIENSNGILNITGDTYRFEASLDFYKSLFEAKFAQPNR